MVGTREHVCDGYLVWFGEEWVVFQCSCTSPFLMHTLTVVLMHPSPPLLYMMQALHFEHRDLHWGNVLVHPTTEASIALTLDGTTHHIPSEGVKATIIDYTLSRMELGELGAVRHYVLLLK